MENIDIVNYDRQEDLENSAATLGYMIHQNVHMVIGCGGIGFWLALSLAMMGARDFILVDGQTIDSSNLNRLPVPQTWIGTNKAIALRKMIRFLRPATRVVVLNSHITDETLDVIPKMLESSYGYEHWQMANIWDTTDNAIIQRKIYDFYERIKDNLRNRFRAVRYRKIGYEAWAIGNYQKWDIWTDEDEYQTGYRTSSANAVTSMLSAGMGIFAMALDRESDFNLNLRKLILEGGNDDVRPEQQMGS